MIAHIVRKGLVFLSALFCLAAHQTLADTSVEAAVEPRVGAAQTLEALLELAEELSVQIPKETFDPSIIIQETGSDPQAIFEWLRKETIFVPYRGSLRGSLGVLMDRNGNSLDLALLLGALLDLAGHEVRLASTIISANEAAALSEAARSPKILRRPAEFSPDASSLLDRLANDPRLDRALLAHRTESSSFDLPELSYNSLLERLDVQSTALMDAVLPLRDLSSAPAAADAIRHHWWIQVRRDREWIDADPTVNSLGVARATPASTLSPNDLPPTELHTVGLRLILEIWDDTGGREEVLLERTFAARDLVGVTLHLGHRPLDPSAGEQHTPDPAQLRSLLAQQRSWVPILTVGTDTFSGRYFTVDGTTAELSTFAFAGPGASGRTVGGAFDRLAQGFQLSPQMSDKDVVTAEWIEYVIGVPGESEQVIRRTIFDTRNPVMRSRAGVTRPAIGEKERQQRALGLSAAYRVGVLSAKPSPEFIAHSWIKQLRTVVPFLIAVLRQDGVLPEGVIARHLPYLLTFETEISSLSLLRHQLSWVDDFVFMRRPNVFIVSRGSMMVSSENILDYTAIDIVANDVDVRVIAGLDPFETRLVQGVADTIAESVILNVGNMMLNTSVHYQNDLDNGIPWIVVDADNKIPHDVAFSEHIKSLIYEDIEDGYIVAVRPPTADASGSGTETWWRIQPVSGNVLGMTALGSGGAVDTLINVAYALSVVQCFTGSAAAIKHDILNAKMIACVFGTAIGFGGISASFTKAFEKQGNVIKLTAAIINHTAAIADNIYNLIR